MSPVRSKTPPAPDAGDFGAMTIVVVLFATAYASYGLVRHSHFGSSAYDLGIFDQAVWHLSRFEAPASTISGFTNILGDHFYPVLALFAPLYWIVPRPETLIVAQGVLLAASIVPVFLYLRRRLPRGTAYAFAVAYGLFWGIQRAAAFDVHEVAFAPLAIATAILAADMRRWGLFWIAALGVVATKEDLIPFLGVFGMYLLIRGDRRQGALLVAASAAAFLLIVRFVVPAFNDSGAYAYASAYQDVIARPWALPITLVTPPVKVGTVFFWLSPFLFLSLGSPLVICALPIAVERFLSASPNHWGTSFHYSAPLAPILAMSAGDGLSRIARRLAARWPPEVMGRVLATVSGVVVLLASLLPGHLPLWRLLDPRTYRETESVRTGREAVAMIPGDASIAAQAAIVPHLSERDRIVMLDAHEVDADYVIAADDLSPWPNDSMYAIRGLLERTRQRGYAVVFEKNGWTVLKRSAPPKGATP